MTEESAVKVCVRVRPLIEREEESTDSTEPGQLFWKAEKHSIQQLDDGNLSKSFNFDRVFNSDETTDQLYQELAKPLVVSAVEGYNGTIFAYGQTSSGKTFTMMGSDLIPGVIPLAMEDVFQTIKNWPKKEFLLRVSYMEIYNETVTDLLCDSWKRKPLEIREGTNKTVYVADLTEELVTSPNQALAWIRKGEKNRHYGKTKMNQRSSRSHTIFRMIIESRESNDNSSGENADGAIIVSHLNLVDLAGTERASQTGAEGTRFKEGCNINRSLFTLGQVIKKLSDESQRGFTNYRDSKLTRILQNSLGGNAKTVIICTITPATIEETVSTLQFASAAKKMKNDPHVTEVSDEGALLKRYRNEIVDLKRRLNEVSSGTQTTESLSQLLQEKDQLQREQQDRIKNLTQLLVTSSNFVPLKKVPKRRETWGGKLLRSADPLDFNVGNVGSYVEPFFKKRKASMLTEQNEDGEDIDSRWYVPDESTFDMDMDQSCVTVRNHLENGSPQRVSELSDKVSCLEQLLETEIQQKREAMEKFQDMDMKMVDLVQQLETEIKQKQEAMEKFQDMDMKMVDLEQQLETEIKKKQEAMETFQDMDMKMVDLQQQLETEIKQKEEAMENLQGMDMKVVDLEKRLEENSQMATNDETQMKREFGDSLQLCETLMAEKAIKSSECDYLKLELGIFIEQTKCLEKDNSALHKELKARKEMDEFKSLEEECKKEYEKELQNEISTLKKTMATSELKCQELKASLETMSEQLKEKSDWAEELQSLSDKDLVQQVKQLRRSLDDAEGLSLDTKKEWAFLRSENISLKERDVTLTADVEKMRAEVNRLHHQLESEKSRFKKMQSDLQRELQGVFDENTKLTTLLDGKVPRNLIDSVELERTVSELKKELQACHEEERTLQAKLDDLAGLQDLPDKVDGLTKQVCDLTEKLCGVQAERDGLVSASAGRDEEILRLQESFQAGQEQLESLQADLSSAALRENSLDLQLSETNTQLENLRQELERSVAHNSQLLTVEESNLRLEESQRQRASVEEKLGEVQELVKVLEEKIADGESVSNREEHSGKTLEEQIKQLGEELESVREERDRLQSDMTDTPQNHSEELEELLSKVTSLTEERDRLQSDKTDTPQNHPEELEELLSKVTSLTEERDQLQEILEGVREERNQFKMDIQENVEMMIENQEELRAALERNREQQKRIKLLETTQSPLQKNLGSEDSRLEELQTHIRQLGEELESVREERDRLQSDKTDGAQNHSEELEELLSKVTSLTEERDRLQSEKTDGAQNHSEELEELLSKVTSLTEERDQLQEILEGVREERNQLKRDIEEMCVVTSSLNHHGEDNVKQQLSSDQQSQTSDNSSLLREQMKDISEELESVREERDRLLSENTDGPQNHSEELEELLAKVTSLTEERDQLQEILEGVREERNQLKRDIEEMEMCVVTSSLNCHGEDNVKQQLSSDQQSQTSDNSSLLREQMKAISEELESVREERDRLQSEKTAGAQNHSEELEELISKVTSLTEERDQLQEILERVREERNQLEKELEQNIESVLQVHAELKQQQHLNSELQTEREQREVQLQQQIKDLEEELATVQTEKSQLKTALQEKMEMASETQGLLSFLQEEHKQRGSVLEEKETVLRQQTKDLSEELDGFRAEQDRLQAKLEELLSKVTSITEERDQLQDILEGVREERNQLKRDLEEAEERMVKAQEDLKEQQDLHNEGEQREVQMKQQIEQLAEEQVSLREEKAELQRNQQDMVHMVLQVQSSLREQQHVREEEQAETKQQEAQFKLQLRKLEENIQALKEAELHLKSEAETSHQLLSEAKQTIQVLTEQIKSLEQSTSVAKAPGERLGLGESSQQLQDCLARFQRVLDVLSQAELAPLEEASVVENKLSLLVLPYVPKPTKKLYSSVFRSTEEAKLRLFETKSVLRGIAEEYRCGFEALVKQDLAVFEERRLQDVLLCRAQAACYSVGGGDLQRGWEQRLSQLNHNRGDYLQKMTRVLEKLEKNVSAYTDALTEQLRTWQLATEDLRAVCEIQPAAPAAVERYLQRELSLRSSAAQHRKTALQGLREEHRALLEELKQAEERAGARMRGERSKTFTLLQGLDKAPIQTEVELLKTNQQLAQQLEHSDTEIKVMQHRVVQLEDAQREVDNRVSTHQQTAQRLQAQLQDACAQVQEKEAANHTLRDRLRKTEAEGKQPPSATEMEMKTRLVNMEVEMTAVSTKHQDEILRMTTMLNHKEEALRKLRETLRKTQQEEEQSFVMEGKELHARLTTTRGRTLQSRVSQEKSKLEVEVSQLQQKIKELESLVSSQHIEISKWKDRALKLKGRRREVFDQSPSTPTRTRLPAMSEGLFLGSPKRGQDSAKPSILDSPKSKFFDARPGSEINFSHPHQFFDNSRLDTIPDGAADKKEEWWPLSPKQEETCKTQ
ncbi:centromere-associated protein E isoform X2 [Hypomesus transpacificus]|uniref:centromere-associated protein E isoform X2 n=1 Tax=Hypomesus transpacificus TaxID=137520 RepID=UPI001F082BCE|nr:centromere-associated protein E isoform X2 [Hypomesus transpacificus]